MIETPVSHHPRRAGTSKYGIRNRAWRAFQDLPGRALDARAHDPLAVREVVRAGRSGLIAPLTVAAGLDRSGLLLLALLRAVAGHRAARALGRAALLLVAVAGGLRR